MGPGAWPARPVRFRFFRRGAGRVSGAQPTPEPRPEPPKSEGVPATQVARASVKLPEAEGTFELTEKGESVLREHLAKYANQPKGR